MEHRIEDDEFEVLSAFEVARIAASVRKPRFDSRREIEHLRDRVRSLESRVWRLEQDR